MNRILERSWVLACVAFLVLALGCATKRGGKKKADETDAADAADGAADATDAGDATDGADSTAGADSADTADGSDGADSTAGADSADTADGSDGADSTAGADSTDAADATDSVDGADGVEVSDASDGTDSPDAADATDGLDGLDGTDGAGGCVATPAVKAVIQSKCEGCHTGGGQSGGLALDDLAKATIGVSTKNGNGILVIPGSPFESYLIAKLQGSGIGQKMPLNGTLSSGELQTIVSWIQGLDCGQTDSSDGTDGIDGVDGTDGADGTDGGSDFGIPAGCITFSAECNPLTNQGCTEAGSACDMAGSTAADISATCYPPPNEQPKGAACGDETGYCVFGHHCGEAATCQKFCCAKADCGAGTCVAFDASLGTIGLCE